MLSARLQTIYDFLPECSFLADIGCDHGFIPIKAVESGLTKRAAACDISKGSLEKADKNIRFSGLTGKIETRLGGGLSGLSHSEADVIVIAGMGGRLIYDILKEGFEKIADAVLILQPMTNISELRKELISGGFSITDEALAKEDRRIYTVIKAKIGESQEDYDCDIGTALIKKHDPLLSQWLADKISAEKALLEKIPPASSDYAGHKMLLNKFTEALKKL